MPECSPALTAFEGWTCRDYDGMSNVEMAATAGRQKTPLLRTILGGEHTLASAANDDFGITGQRQMALLITVLAAIAIAFMYAVFKGLSAVCHACWRFLRFGQRRVPVREPTLRRSHRKQVSRVASLRHSTMHAIKEEI